jgi:glutamine cyclotransferase
LHFDASHSYDSDDQLYSYSSYSWEFGDGETQSYGTEADHVYERAGMFRVNLTVRDEHGAIDKASLDVRIRDPENITINANGTWTEGIWNYGDYFLTITMQNQAPFAIDIDEYYGFSLETAGESYSLNGHEGIIPDELLSGGSATWIIFFELPAGAIPVRLVYDDHIVIPLA